MVAGVGNKIEAADYNAIQQEIALVLGTGSLDYGYGQPVSSSIVATNAKISVTQWNNLQNDILKCRAHQGASDTLTTATTSVKITEADRAAYLTATNNAKLNRLAVPSTPTNAAREDLAIQTRTTNWNGTLTQTVTVTFPGYTQGGVTLDAANHARVFFNSGGRFEFSASRAGGSNTPKDVAWTTLLTNMGTIYFDRSSTSCTGSGTPTSSLGWAGLTASDQIIFQKNSPNGTTYYPNSYDIYARLGTSTAQIIFTINFRDASGQPNPPWGTDEDVTGTLTSTTQIYRAFGTNVNVPTAGASSTTL